MIAEEKILPKDWKLSKMEEVCDIISGKNQSKVINPNGKYPIYGSSGIFGYADEYLCNEGTTVVGRKGTINSPLFVNTKFWNVDTAFGLSPKENYNNKLLYYFCLSFNFHNLDKSTTIPSLAKRDLLSIDIPLPPKPTQQAIVSKIEELFSELDKGIEQLKIAQQQLKTYRQSVLKWAFEGKLTNEILKEGELPKGWKKVQIKDVALINPKLPNKENIDSSLEVQFLPMKLIEEIINKIHLVDTKKFQEVQKGSYTPFIDGDIIFAKVTPCMENGKIAVVDKLKNGIGYGSSEFHVIRCTSEAVNKYIFYFLVQDRFRSEAENAMTGAVGLRRVPKQFIENYIIPLPSIEEQNKIVQEIESRLSLADKMEESITQSLQQAEALRQSILKKAFEGKLL